MFSIGERVVYGIHGVCQIIDLEEKRVNAKVVTYYVLQPLDQPQSRFYVPKDNPAAVAKLNKLLTKQELDDLLHGELENVWIEDEGHRKQCYTKLISSGDRASLISMLRCLYIHRAQQALAGRKLHLCDENFMRDAKHIIEGEISLVLDIPIDQVGKYLAGIFEK